MQVVRHFGSRRRIDAVGGPHQILAFERVLDSLLCASLVSPYSYHKQSERRHQATDLAWGNSGLGTLRAGVFSASRTFAFQEVRPAKQFLRRVLEPEDAVTQVFDRRVTSCEACCRPPEIKVVTPRNSSICPIVQISQPSGHTAVFSQTTHSTASCQP